MRKRLLAVVLSSALISSSLAWSQSHKPSEEFYFERAQKFFKLGKAPTTRQLEGTWMVRGITSLPDKDIWAVTRNEFNASGIRNPDGSLFSQLVFKTHNDFFEKTRKSEVIFYNLGYQGGNEGPKTVGIINHSASFGRFFPNYGLMDSLEELRCRLVKQDHLLCAVILRLDPKEFHVVPQALQELNDEIFQYIAFHKIY